MGKWKAVRKAPAEPLELYDLSADLGETKNLASDHADVVARIETCLAGARSPSKDWSLRSRKKVRG